MSEAHPWPDLPPVLYVEDVRAALPYLSLRGAQRAIKGGKLGPHNTIGGRLVLRRDTFLKALAAKGGSDGRR